jgi:hypothetical protein
LVSPEPVAEQENAQQAPSQSIDCPGAVGREIGALGGAHAQLGDYVVPELQLAQVAPGQR